MTKNKKVSKVSNDIWYEFVMRSANCFNYDLADFSGNLLGVTDTQLFSLIVAIDRIVTRSKIFKEELGRRGKR